MFGWLRKRQEKAVGDMHQLAAEAAYETKKFVIQVEASLRGLPEGLLNDPFFIGLISMHATINVRLMTGGNAPMVVIERTMIKSLELVFSQYACTSQQAMGKLYEFKNNAEYAKGVRAANLIQSAAADRSDIASQAEVVIAREKVEGLPSPLREEFGKTKAERLAYQLTANLVLTPLKAKYLSAAEQ